MSTRLYRVGKNVHKPIPTRLLRTYNAAIVVPVNDTRTQLTTSLPPIKKQSYSDTETIVKESRKIKSQNDGKASPASTMATIITVVVAPMHNL